MGKGTTSRRPRSKGGVETPPLEETVGSAKTVSSFQLKDIFTPAVALDVRLKFYEVVVALLILICTIFIGFNSNNLLSRQNIIVARLGRQQYHAELLQGYISATQQAGFSDADQRRMFRLSLDLYDMLLRDDPQFRTLARSMPSITDDDLRQLIARSPGEADAILQLAGRRGQISRLSSGEAPYRIDADGPVHLVIGTFESADGARARLQAAVDFLGPSRFRPRMNIMKSREFFLATLSGFETRQDAQNAIARESLETAFEGVYASLQNGWIPVCSAQFQPCTSGPAPPRRRPNASPRQVPSNPLPAPHPVEPDNGAAMNAAQ